MAVRRVCDRCGTREAVIRVRHLEESLCEECLSASMRRRVWSALGAGVTDGDRIVAALSGGKDSSLALFYLSKYRENSDEDFGLSAITIDEGSAYRKRAIQKARELTSLLGIDHRVIELRELYGVSAPEIRSALPPNGRRTACTYCGVLRRQALNIEAREMRATKLATGHNLDDLAQTLVMNLVRGDLSAMARLLSKSPSSPKLIPRLRPLTFISEREAAVRALLLRLPVQFGKCPDVLGMRIHVRRILNLAEEEVPGLKRSIVENIIPLVEKARVDIYKGFELRFCEKCGEPTTGRLCKVCEFRNELQRSSGMKLLAS